jgi:hypothetical protein
MPLIDIQTNLKSLGYGHDRPDGGSSNQPYIKTPVDVDLGLNPGSVGARVLGSDFLLRGGVLGAVNASATDVVRLSKFFNPLERGASYNGALFVAKQLVLERQNVDVVDDRSRTYLPTNTIAQAGVNAFGLHLDKTGINPFKAGYYGNGDTGYYPVTLRNDTEEFSDGSHNRLQLLYQVKRLGNETSDSERLTRTIRNNPLASSGLFLSTLGIAGIAGTRLTGGSTTDLLISSAATIGGLIAIAASPKNKLVPIKLASNLYGITDPNDNVNLISYNGGPGSFLGIGNTNIKIWNPLKFKNPDYWKGPSGEPTNIVKNEQYNNNPSLYLVPDDANIKPSYFSPKINRSFGSQTYFPARTRNGIQKIVNPNLAISPDSNTINNMSNTGDIIDFAFSLINNDNPGQDTTFSFRAYIEDFSDTFNGEWDTYKYVGRGENFYKYKGFNRDMSISFVVPAISRADIITNYQKINALIWAVMPDYSEKGLMRGQLAKFTMGDYLRDSLVVIRNISLTPIMDMGFELNMDPTDTVRLYETSDEYVGQLPKGIKVQCNITPLTQGVSGTTIDNTGQEQAVTYYYTPQRGEAFIGNRKHVIVDRTEIANQYIGSADFNIEPTDPLSSPLYTLPEGL